MKLKTVVVIFSINLFSIGVTPFSFFDSSSVRLAPFIRDSLPSCRNSINYSVRLLHLNFNSLFSHFLRYLHPVPSLSLPLPSHFSYPRSFSCIEQTPISHSRRQVISKKVLKRSLIFCATNSEGWIALK